MDHHGTGNFNPKSPKPNPPKKTHILTCLAILTYRLYTTPPKKKSWNQSSPVHTKLEWRSLENLQVKPPKSVKRKNVRGFLVGGWFTNPFEKYAQVKLDHFTRDRDENRKYLSCHHLDVFFGGKVELILSPNYLVILMILGFFSSSFSRKIHHPNRSPNITGRSPKFNEWFTWKFDSFQVRSSVHLSVKKSCFSAKGRIFWVFLRLFGFS